MPCDGGVLEFGTFTKDRRGSTFGGEYQEAAREYRRTVFTNDNWAGHRSEGLKSLETIFDSGVLRGRWVWRPLGQAQPDPAQRGLVRRRLADRLLSLGRQLIVLLMKFHVE